MVQRRPGSRPRLMRARWWRADASLCRCDAGRAAARGTGVCYARPAAGGRGLVSALAARPAERSPARSGVRSTIRMSVLSD
eukprot:2566364-Prymnesium_polylepis.1